MTEEIKELKVENEIQKELEIDEKDISSELGRQPSKFFYWATTWALASRKSRKIRLKRREVEARLSKEYRLVMKEDDPKLRVTEKILDDYLAEHSEYKVACEEEIQAEYMADMLGVAKEAFKVRSQALVELSRSSIEEKFYGNEVKAFATEIEVRDAHRKKRKEKEGKENVI